MINFYKIFFGQDISWEILGELFIRIIFMYSYCLINIRFIGRKTFRQLSSFDLIIIYAIATALSDPMFQFDIPLVYCMVVITTMIILEVGISALVYKSPTVENIIEGQPRVLVENGIIINEALRKEGLSKNELEARLRVKGIESLNNVRLAILEASGDLSVLKKSVNNE